MNTRPLAPASATALATATRRAPFAFGPRFFLLLAAGLILIVPAWLEPRAIWILAGWNLLVAALWLADLRRIPSTGRISVTRTWPSALSLGVPSRVSLTVQNLGTLPVQVDTIDDVPVALKQEVARSSVMVAAGASTSTDFDVVPSERGDRQVGEVFLRVRSPWAVAERWLTAPAGQVVRVYPDIAAARRQSMYLLRSRQVALEKRRARLVGLGWDFDSLRDYQPGDDPRDICWTATARRAKPVTKLYRPERSQAVWIVVDSGRLLRARVGAATKLDSMVDAALALSDVALGAGDRVGLLTYGRRRYQRLPPDRGPQHLRAILEALAVVTPERAEADHAAAAAAVMAAQKPRALIVWLTELAETAGTPDVVEQASTLSPHHVVLFAVARPTEMMSIEAAAPQNEDEMYRMLAVQEMLRRRDALLRGLTKKGVLVLEMPPAAPAAALIDQYLTVKERSLV